VACCQALLGLARKKSMSGRGGVSCSDFELRSRQPM
jgi:hypothetical protein